MPNSSIIYTRETKIRTENSFRSGREIEIRKLGQHIGILIKEFSIQEKNSIYTILLQYVHLMTIGN